MGDIEMSNPNGFTFEWVAQAAGLKPREVKVIGHCANCYHDIIDGDQMDCCGNLKLIPTKPTRSNYVPDEQQDEEDQMEFERTFVPE